MPKAIRVHKPRTVSAPSKTLQERRAETGRTLALNGTAWRRLRALVLSANPLCPRCHEAGYLVPATEVDHVDGDPTNNSRDNLVGLCKMHHSQKTRLEMNEKITSNRETRTVRLTTRAAPRNREVTPP